MQCCICKHELIPLIHDIVYCTTCFYMNKPGQEFELSFLFNHAKNTLVIYTIKRTSNQNIYSLSEYLRQFTFKFAKICLVNVLEYTYCFNNIIDICKSYLKNNGEIVFTTNCIKLNEKNFIFKWIFKPYLSFFTTETLRYLAYINNLSLTKTRNRYIFRFNGGMCDDIKSELLNEIENEMYMENTHVLYKKQYALYKTIFNELICLFLQNGYQIKYLCNEDKRFIDWLCSSDKRQYIRQLEDNLNPQNKIHIFTFKTNPNKIEKNLVYANNTCVNLTICM